MPATTLAWNDPRVMNRVAEQYKQLRAKVDKLRVLQKQLEQGGGAEATLTAEQRAQLELLPGALEDLRELREGRMPAHPIALLSSNSNTITTGASPSGTSSTAATTVLVAASSKKAKKAARGNAQDLSATKEAVQTDVADADKTTSDEASTTTSNKNNKKTASGTAAEADVVLSGRADDKAATDATPDITTTGQMEEVDEEEGGDKTSKSKKKNKKNTKKKNNNKAAPANEAEAEAAAAVEEEEDDPSDRATWLRRLSRQIAPKARQALLEDYVAYYLSSSAACSPALLAAAEKKLKAAMECKKRVLQCYEQGKPPSKKQLDTIEQLPALRKQLAQCARQVKLEAEKAKAELLAAFEAQQQQEAEEEEKKKKQEQEERAGAGAIEPELAAMNNAKHNTQDDHPQQPNTTAAHMTSTTPPPSASTTAALGSSTGLSLAITNTTTTTTTTARCSSGSVGAMLPASSSSSLAGAGEDGVLVNVKSAATPTVATAAPARRGEEGGGQAEEEEKEGTHTGEAAASKQEEEMNEEDEKAEGEDTTKANDKAQQHANADEDEEEEDKTQDITEERTTTTNTTTATLAAAEHETLSTADALLHSVAPAANITIQSGSEWARVLRYCAPTGPTSSNTTIYASHCNKKEEEGKECNAQGDEAAMTMRTPTKPRRAVGVRAQNNGFTLRGFYSLIPRSSPLAQPAEPRRRKSLKADKKAAEEEGHDEEAVQTKSSRKQRRMSSSASSASSQKMKDKEEDGALHAPSTQAKKAKPQPVTLPCTAVPETRAALSYYRLQLCLSHRDRTAAAAAAKEEEEEQQHSYVGAKPLGREVDDHTRRLVSAITASSASHNTVRGEEGCGGKLPGLRGRPMLQARLAADWAAVQAALHNNNNGGGEEPQQQQQQQAVLLPPGLSLLSCCDHTPKAHTEEANYEAERKEGETADAATAAAGGTYTSSFVEANTPLVSWLLSYAPRCGPLAGHIVPLELVSLHSYPFVAPRLFSLVSLPHQRLVLAQGGRPNMLYLPIAAAASSSPSSTSFAANSNNDTQGVSALSLPASPCSPMTGSPTTLSPLTSHVLDMLARVPDFFEGGGFAETCRALGAEAFDTQLAQARLTLGKVWLALHHALQQQQQQQHVRDDNNNNCSCAEAVRWCNGPYLMLEQQAPQQPRKDTHSEADDTAAKSAAKHNSEAGGSIAHEESEEDTSKAQVVLYTEACKDTAAQECGVRGPWRGCWGHLLYTLPTSTHTNAASAQHTPSAMSAHTALRAEHELCVQLIQQRTTTTPSGSQADDDEEAAMPTLQLVRLPWSSLVCEAMNSNISAYKDQAHWAQQVLLLLPPPSQPMPHDEEDNASTTTTTNTTTATTQGNALQHVCWSLPRSLWSACNSAKNNHDMNEAAHAVHTAQVCIKAGRDAHCTLSQEETAAGVTTITLPTSASCAGDEPRQLDENESSTKNNKAEEEKGCVWALVLNVPAGQTVSMTITLRQAVHEEEDTTVPEDAQDTLCHAIDGGNKQADDDEEEAVKVHNNKMQADGVQQKKTSSATPRDTAEQSSTAVRGMLLAVPYGFSAARVAALPRPGPGSSTSSAACKTGKDTLSVGLCESSTGFYEDYYIPRGVSAVQGGSQALAGTHEAPPLEMNEAEFFLYRQLTPCAAADRTPTAQTNEDEEESEKGLCVACHDYLVAPPENALRRALLQLEPSPKANSNNNNTTSTTASSPSSAAERSRNVASRAVRERHLRADYFWGLRVMFLPCMSHTLRSHVLSHAAAAVSSDTSDAQTAGMAPTALTRMLRPSEHQALRRFMQSCMQLYRQPAASTAYAIPLQPLHLLHLLSLSLLHVLPQDTSETDITPCSSAAAQDILALVVALAAKEESLRELCRSIVRDQADALCPSITTKTPKMNEADGEAPAVCTLFLQMPYFPSPWAKRREASESASPPPSAAQRARTAYESALSYVAARLEDSLAGDKVVREAAAAHYVRLLQCTAFYLALQSVHQLSCVAEGEEGESTAGSAQGDKTSATKASKQRAEQILQELQNEEEEAIEGEEAGETYTILRHIHRTMLHGAAVA